MKVVLVTEFYYPHTGGITEHVHHLGHALVRAGHEVTVLTNHVAEAPRRADVEDDGGLRIVRVGVGVPVESNGSQSRITVGANLERKVREVLLTADLVHVHSPLFPILPYVALKLARRLNLPTVGTFHTNFSNNKAWGFFRNLITGYASAIDCCIAVSESAHRSVAEYVKQPFLRIPNGIDISAWAAGQARPDLAGMRNIVFLGRLDPRNDVEALIGSFVALAERHHDIRLILIGDGARRSACEAAVPPHLTERVMFAGAQVSLKARADLLASATVFAFTARIASHPMSLIEAMGAGRAVVAYDIEGMGDLVVDGETGFLSPLGKAPGDNAGLTATLERALAAGDATRARLGLAARARVEEFDWPRVAARIERVYRSVVAGKPLPVDERVFPPAA